EHVMGKTAARHTSTEFVDFLGQIVASQPEDREIHIVADNLSALKTKNVFEFLQANPKLTNPLRPDLFQLAQSGGDLVFQNSTRCHLSGNLYFYD
ncbi:MAG: hypothetical protein WB586_07820, partial [Chthoniobacterales bacterium]